MSHYSCAHPGLNLPPLRGSLMQYKTVAAFPSFGLDSATARSSPRTLATDGLADGNIEEEGETILRNKINLASVIILFSLVVGSLVSTETYAASQDQPAVIRTSLQATARTLNFHGKDSKMWSWVPEFKFSLTRGRDSGDKHYIEYTIPGGPALKFDCELNQRGDGFECGGRSIPEDKGSIYTGPVNFAIKVRNELTRHRRDGFHR